MVDTMAAKDLLDLAAVAMDLLQVGLLLLLDLLSRVLANSPLIFSNFGKV
jgi:hypothetical protein